MDYSKIPSYELIKEESIPDIGTDAVLLRHKKCRAKVALLPCDDSNKVFDIVFRTPPKDSCGTAHIVEHTVLCGSEKYPLKDPFIELAKGSFNTFLNAITFPDKTMYPVASTNHKDFMNLVQVYLDAVFNPNIYNEENIFRQEGWGYRIENADEPLKYSGVVYSEMKGVFSSADDINEYEIKKSLFPDTIYSYESGGDPEYITDLSYEQFLDFHRMYYHPSNCYIYIYGDADFETILNYLDEEYLSKYDYLEVDSEINMQESFNETRELYVKYPVSDEDDIDENSYLSYNLVVGDCFDIKKAIAFEALDYALFSAQGAPIRQALLDEGIGSYITSGYIDGIRQPYFSICVQNAKSSNKDRFVSIIKDKLKEYAENGIEKDSLLARLYNLEFQFREADYGTYPKGLMYIFVMMDTWLYDENRAFDELHQLSVFDELIKEIENDTKYFENLIKEELLDNPHSTVIVLEPEKGLESKREKAVSEKLDKIKSDMSDDEIEDLIEKTRKLKQYQETEDSEEAKKMLPVLKLSDIKKEANKYSNIVSSLPCGNDIVKIVQHNTNTNGINYVNILFRADHIKPEEVTYFAIAKNLLKRINTKSHTYLELTNLLNKNTGGLGFSINSFKKTTFGDDYVPYFSIGFKALYDKTSTAFDLVKEILLESDFTDTKRLKDIISEEWTAKKTELSQSGHSTAMLRSNAYFDAQAAFSEYTGGIEYYRVLDRIQNDFDEYADKLPELFKGLIEKALGSNEIIASITADDEGTQLVENQLRDFIENIRLQYPLIYEEPEEIVKPLGFLNEGFSTSGQVQYVAQSGNYKKSGFDYTGALNVLRQILNYDYLWNRIRVDGNAYGCGCIFDRSGNVKLMSYRDPRLTETFDVFNEVTEYVHNFTADSELMKKYIIGTLSVKDMPLNPSAYGYASFAFYMSGISNEEIQKERDEIIASDQDKIRELEALLRAALDYNAKCAVGSQSAINNAKGCFNSIKSLT